MLARRFAASATPQLPIRSSVSRLAFWPDSIRRLSMSSILLDSYLNVRGADVTDEAINQFKLAVPNCFVWSEK